MTGHMNRVALLRGINVGGNRKIPMADLRLALQKAGFEQVQTYIQNQPPMTEVTGLHLCSSAVPNTFSGVRLCFQRTTHQGQLISAP